MKTINADSLQLGHARISPDNRIVLRNRNAEIIDLNVYGRMTEGFRNYLNPDPHNTGIREIEFDQISPHKVTAFLNSGLYSSQLDYQSSLIGNPVDLMLRDGKQIFDAASFDVFRVLVGCAESTHEIYDLGKVMVKHFQVADRTVNGLSTKSVVDLIDTELFQAVANHLGLFIDDDYLDEICMKMIDVYQAARLHTNDSVYSA